MTRRIASALIGCAMAVAAAGGLLATPQRQSDVRIDVSQKQETIPGVAGEWTAFVGTVVNGSRSPITLEAYRLPGGYMGTGLIFGVCRG